MLSKNSFFKTWKWGHFSHQLIDFKCVSGSENLSGLNDLIRHDNITGLNDLNNIFGLYCLHFTYWVISLASGSSAASMTSTASITSVASMTSTASFHQKTWGTWCFHQPKHQNDLSWSLNVEWIIKNPLFYWFLALFLLEAVEAMDVTFNQIQGS